MRVRAYLSTCFGCPFEGKVDAGVVAADVEKFASLGVTHVALGDTIGAAQQIAETLVLVGLSAGLPALIA